MWWEERCNERMLQSLSSSDTIPMNIVSEINYDQPKISTETYFGLLFNNAQIKLFASSESLCQTFGLTFKSA